MQKRSISYFIRIVPFSDDDDDDNRIEKNDEKVRDIKILTKGNRDSEVKKLIKTTKWTKCFTVNSLLPPVSGVFPEIIIFIIYQPVVSNELFIKQNVKKLRKYLHWPVKTKRFGTRESWENQAKKCIQDTNISCNWNGNFGGVHMTAQDVTSSLTGEVQRGHQTGRQTVVTSQRGRLWRIPVDNSHNCHTVLASLSVEMKTVCQPFCWQGQHTWLNDTHW